MAGSNVWRYQSKVFKTWTQNPVLVVRHGDGSIMMCYCSSLTYMKRGLTPNPFTSSQTNSYILQILTHLNTPPGKKIQNTQSEMVSDWIKYAPFKLPKSQLHDEYCVVLSPFLFCVGELFTPLHIKKLLCDGAKIHGHVYSCWEPSEAAFCIIYSLPESNCWIMK